MVVAKYRWWLLIGAMVACLAVATIDVDRSPRTPQERVTFLADQVRCPTCAGLSVEQSDAPLAQSSKEEIRTRVAQGQSDEQIRAYFVSRYGSTALVSPERTGLNRVPWFLPVLLIVVLAVAFVFVMRSWRQRNVIDIRSPSEADRLLVEAALKERV